MGNKQGGGVVGGVGRGGGGASSSAGVGGGGGSGGSGSGGSSGAGYTANKKPFHKWEREILKSTFNDLASRSASGKSIEKEIFLRFFFNVPGMLGERLFHVFNTSHSGSIDQAEFINGLATYTRGSLEQKIQFVYNMCKLNDDPKQGITKQELETMLSSFIFATDSIIKSTNSTSHSASTPTHSTAATPHGASAVPDIATPAAPPAGVPSYLNIGDSLGHQTHDSISSDHGSSTSPTPLPSPDVFSANSSQAARIKEMIDCAFKLAKEDSNSDDSKELTLSVYVFAKWLQNYPEVLQVLDVAFAGKDGIIGGGTAHSPAHPDDEDYTEDPAHRSPKHGHSNSFGHGHPPHPHPPHPQSQAHSQPHHSHSHGHGHKRNVSINNVITPTTLTNPDEGLLGVSAGSAPTARRGSVQRKIWKCAQCTAEFVIKYCFKCGERLPGVDNLNCNACGEIFLGAAFHFCFVCGFDMSLAGRGPIEPPLVKSLSWQRMQMTKNKHHVQEGYLKKVGARLKNIVTRWYVIRDNFMYSFSKPTDVKPTNVLFLEGCFVESVNHEDKNSKLKYGIEIILNEEPRKSRLVYASSTESRQQWLDAIRAHTNVHDIEEFYSVGPELGVGRFSSVREATSKQTGKKYAVKIIDKSEVDEKEREALRMEVAVMKLVNHPNIIKLKNVFETRKQIFIVMSLIKGGDLFDRIVKRKRLTESVCQQLMLTLLNVLDYLHSIGIIHRDLKPENLMMRSEEDDADIVATDFGLSKFAVPSELMTMQCGTLAYVAPEVLSGKGYGKEVDVWSCGIIMYLILRGVLPFDSDNREEIIAKTLAGRLSFEHPIWKDISADAKDLISALLRVDPSQRLTTSQALQHKWFKLQLSAPKPPPTSQSNNQSQAQVVAGSSSHSTSTASPSIPISSPSTSPSSQSQPTSQPLLASSSSNDSHPHPSGSFSPPIGNPAAINTSTGHLSAPSISIVPVFHSSPPSSPPTSPAKPLA